MRTLSGPAGDVPRRLGLKLDPDDLAILSALYFGGVCGAGRLRLSLRLSRLTFHLRVRRLKRAHIIAGAADAVDGDLHNLNLTVAARAKLFALETDIRAAGLFEGRLTGEGTGAKPWPLKHWNYANSAQSYGGEAGEWIRDGSIE